MTIKQVEQRLRDGCLIQIEHPLDLLGKLTGEQWSQLAVIRLAMGLNQIELLAAKKAQTRYSDGIIHDRIKLVAA